MKKILMYRWKAYNYIDIRECFKRMGYEVVEDYQKLESYDVDEEYTDKLRSILQNDSFEFVFTVNYFALISNVCEDLQIPYVSWSCDNPLISMYHDSVFNKCNFIFTFDQSNYCEFRDMGVEHIYYLPLAVDASRIDHIIKTSDDLSLYQNDIAFVGSLYERNSYDRIEPELSDYERGYFDSLMLAQSDLYGVNIIDRMLTPEVLSHLESKFKLNKSEGSFSDLGLIFSTTTLGFKIAALQRRKALIDLSKKHQVSIYSNSDTSDLINVDYRGSVDYWTEMPKVFNQSKINLNITIPNIRTGIPLRMWDVLGSGGFLLTNFQTEIPLFFHDGIDLVSFKCQEEMLEKADYYLRHDSERSAIAIAGHDLVLENHTYENRIEVMLETLSQNL